MVRATIVIQVKDEPEEKEVYSRIREMQDWVQERRVRRRTWQESKVLAVPSASHMAGTSHYDRAPQSTAPASAPVTAATVNLWGATSKWAPAAVKPAVCHASAQTDSHWYCGLDRVWHCR